MARLCPPNPSSCMRSFCQPHVLLGQFHITSRQKHQTPGKSASLSRQEENMMDSRTGFAQDRDCATSGHGQELKLEPCFQTDSLLPSPSASLIPQLSHTMVGRNLDPTILFPSSQAAALPHGYKCGACPGEEAQPLAFLRSRAPAPMPCAGDGDQLSNQHPREQLCDRHLRAKRARVESIIQGMSLPPTPQAFDTSREAAFRHERERGGEMPQESKRKPRMPQQGMGAAGQVAPTGGSSHATGCQQLKEQLCFLEQQLRWLQEKFYQVCDSENAAQMQEDSEKVQPLPGKHEDRLNKDSATFTSSPHKVPLRRSVLEVCGVEEAEDRGDTGDLPSAVRVLSQALKHELSVVTSQVVDSVLKTVWPKADSQIQKQHHSLPVLGSDARREYSAGGKCRKPLTKPSSMDAPGSLGSPQAEVLPRALGKSPGSYAASFSSKGVRKSSRVPSMGYALGSATPVQHRQLLSQLLGYGQHSLWGSDSRESPSALERGCPEPLNLPWGTVKLRSSTVRQQQHHALPLSPASMESLALLPAGRDGHGQLPAANDGAPFALTHISFGGSWRSLGNVLPSSSGATAWHCPTAMYVSGVVLRDMPSSGFAMCRLSLTPRQMQEVLTPGHLKKAKLMFFFTRYPSSTLLKTYFLDVQFSRCITSQLIKWFSNFREFYYIQVEKFARQALLEGVVDACTLQVSRDSELFRALNMHYNKGNDFEVPGRFLEVASLTLQEFFSAVRAGKDADPSWKKPIYKIISKLDSDIPEGFKAAGCSQELLHK
ncbi:Prospero homeobox protein 1 [Lonchura striata]|uniref:Prospero homeobox protein 1 n=1 Tax=Lonchura striata TaxID=40157 RepID=A0A218VDE0_9PASE|nr:Prospero homeobox protein 1 [Lonchura striata domestica]